jgi:hypothetical protein
MPGGLRRGSLESFDCSISAMDIRLNSEQLLNMILQAHEVPSVACQYPPKASQYHLGKEFRSRSSGLRTFTKFSGETFDDDVRTYGNVKRNECRQARSEDSDECHHRGEDGSCPNVPGYRCEQRFSLFWRPCRMCTQPNLRTCEVTQIFFKRVDTGETASTSGRYHIPEMCWR